MIQEESEEFDNSLVCGDCLREDYLSAMIKSSGSISVCTYCSRTKNTLSLEKIADKVEMAFEIFYSRTSLEPDGMDEIRIRVYGEDWDREGDRIGDIIQEVLKVKTNIATDIQQILEQRHWSRSADEIGEESEFAEDSHYIYKGVSADNWEIKWKELETILKKQTRFFSTIIQATLSTMFSNMEKLQTAAGEPVIKYMGPNHPSKDIFRARSFSSFNEVEIALSDVVNHLGPPPHNKARAGRMNAVGISVFYGATDLATAIAEVRPPVGAYAVVAKFVFLREVKLLDLRTLKDLDVKGSIFDEEYAKLASRVQFMKQLGDRLTEPVMPDNEATDYLVTQAVADYLSESTNFDGIIFRSIQAGGDGFNIILFHKTSKVKKRDVPIGTKSYLYTDFGVEDDPELTYTIIDEIPDPSLPSAKINTIDVSLFLTRKPGGGGREAALFLDPDTIIIHTINAVRFDYSSNEVKLKQTKKRTF